MGSRTEMPEALHRGRTSARKVSGMSWLPRASRSGRLGFLLCIWTTLALLDALPALADVSQWTFGGTGLAWQDHGVLDGLETTSQGQLRPRFTFPDENLSLTAEGRGGGVNTPIPTLKSTILEGNNLSNMIDGDPDVAFRSELSNNQGLFIVLDLGASLGVNRIVFYARPSTGGETFPFLQGYRLLINDGTPETQDDAGPVWTVVDRRNPNRSRRVQVDFPLQFIRYIKLESLVVFDWEIAEFEVFGEGFTPTASYTSEILRVPGNVGQAGTANWGKLRWSHSADQGASMNLLVRSGDTPDIYRYFRVETDELTTKKYLEPTTREEYEELGEPKAIREFDRDHWSRWSEPLPPTGKEQVPAPAPRSYFQFMATFESSKFDAGAMLDSLSIEYEAPPLAAGIEAAIAPRRAEAGISTPFTYSLVAQIDPDAGHTGFDALEITTPARPTFRRLSIDDVQVNLAPEEITEAADRLVLRFPDHRVDINGTAMEVLFECPVFAYGTTFDGKVFNTADAASDGLPQIVVPDERIGSRALAVAVGLGKAILASLTVQSNPFTPNGDGINDEAALAYAILKVSEPISVSVHVYDLVGKSVRRVFAGQEASGEHQHFWDGRDDYGRLVPPGIYLARVTAETAVQTDHRSTVVMVAY